MLWTSCSLPSESSYEVFLTYASVKEGMRSTFGTPVPPFSQQSPDQATTALAWMIVAIFLLVVALLLAITSVALGGIVYRTRKDDKSSPNTKQTIHEGSRETHHSLTVSHHLGGGFI